MNWFKIGLGGEVAGAEVLGVGVGGVVVMGEEDEGELVVVEDCVACLQQL